MIPILKCIFSASPKFNTFCPYFCLIYLWKRILYKCSAVTVYSVNQTMWHTTIIVYCKVGSLVKVLASWHDKPLMYLMRVGQVNVQHRLELVDECCDPGLQGPGSSNAPALREAAVTVDEGKLKGFSQGILVKQLPIYYIK